LNERDELKELATALRAHAEWQLATGAIGSPASERQGRAPHATGARAPAARGAGYPQTGNTGPSRIPGSPAGAARGNAPPAGRDAATGTTSDAAGARAEGGAATAHANSNNAQSVSLSPEREAARVRLVALAEEVKSCTKCALYAGRTQTVFARGNTAAEDAEGFPFVGKAGQLLDRMIAAMGYARDDVYICNIVKCRPPSNRKPEPDEMSQCAPYLREQLELVAPKVIVALGATAVEGLLGAGGGITRLRGQWKLYRAIPVMPTFHPAYLLRTPEAKREVWADLQAVLKQLGRTPPTGGRSA
jgi:uracil-DNA glycosylase family 4